MGFSAKEHYAEFGNGRRDNKTFTLSAGQSVTCHFKADGTDDAENKYYNLGSTAKKVGIINNVLATITHIGGTELSSPIRLGTATQNKWLRGIEWIETTVRADQDATTFEIYAS